MLKKLAFLGALTLGLGAVGGCEAHEHAHYGYAPYGYSPYGAQYGYNCDPRDEECMEHQRVRGYAPYGYGNPNDPAFQQCQQLNSYQPGRFVYYVDQAGIGHCTQRY